MTETEQSVVLVTGSSGCLGQHVVKLLQQNDNSVKQIRCLDLKPYQNNLHHSTEKQMQIITGDIRNERVVVNALQGVDCVIHCASVINIDLWPDNQLMQSVNVDGTQILIDAAIECNVKYFIYVSCIDVVIGDDQIYYGAENTTPIAKKHVLGKYSQTKCEAETIVAQANNRSLNNGTDKLLTVILRPTVLYGEEDNHFVSNALKLAKEQSGSLRRIDNVFVRFQPTYAGNAAWACIKAKNKLTTDQSIGGEAFFITDDTEILDPFDFLKPYLQCKGYTLSKYAYPYWLFMFIFYLLIVVIRMLWSIYPINLPQGLTPNKVKYICNTYFFNRNKAILRLNYEPFYNPEESQEKSIQYYKRLYL